MFEDGQKEEGAVEKDTGSRRRMSRADVMFEREVDV